MLAARFDRKAAMRETWLSENQRLVSQVVKVIWFKSKQKQMCIIKFHLFEYIE